MTTTPPADDGLAIEMLMRAARGLPLASREELSRRLVEHLLLARQHHDHDLSPHAARRQHLVGALRAVSETIAHAPNTVEYRAENDRRQALGEPALPSPSSIIREFSSWAGGLAAAGLIPTAPPSAFQRRRTCPRTIVHRYSAARLRECLIACARDLGRIPMLRDYIPWREEALDRQHRARTAVPGIPHYRTYYSRYENWDAALADAGLTPGLAARTETTDYAQLPPLTGPTNEHP